MLGARMMACSSVLTLLLMALLSTKTWGSQGDRQPTYGACVSKCLSSGCASLPPADAQAGKVICPSVCSSQEESLLITALWSCQDDCRYRCMWAIEHSRQKASAEGSYAVYKYHGKWPFLRVWGMQELLSVVASLGNLAAHIAGFSRLKQSISDIGGLQEHGSGPAYPFYLWEIYFSVSCVAWVASAVFHSRDNHLTESLDYGAANVAIAAGLWASVTRCGGPWAGRWAAAAIVAGLCFHIGHMHLVKFDYGRNMAVCVSVGVIQTCMWTSWVWMKRHPGRWPLTAFMVAVNTAMLLEVLDFPPLASLLDAHAAWHFATIPLVGLWYRFVNMDVQWMLGLTAPQAARKRS